MEKITVEQLHNESVTLIKGKCAKLFLPFILCTLPLLVIEILTFGLAFVLAGFVWILFDNSIIKLAVAKPNCNDELAKSIGNKPTKYSYFHSYYQINIDFKKVFIISLLKRLMILGGLVLLIIPGIYIWLSFSMTSFLMSDNKELTVREILMQSYDLIKFHRLQLLRTYAYCFLAILVTIGTFGLLLPWTVTYISAIKFNFYHYLVDGKIPLMDIKKSLKINTNSNKDMIGN